MRILQIGTIDKAGGAAQISWSLKQELEKRGHQVSMFVQDKISQDPRVFKIPPTFPKQGIVSRLLANDIDFYRTDYILKTKEFQEADIVHCHNLHGYFFKLDTLRKMSGLKPVVWTLHDMWAVSPHCAYTFNDEPENGFYQCQSLHDYPQIEWHNEKYLSWRKKSIYQKSQFYLVTPSDWLRNLVGASVLKNKPVKTIYNGIETDIFKPADKRAVRQELGLPQDKKIVLFVAAGGKTDPRKGWSYVQELIENFKNREDLLFLCLGGNFEDRTNQKVWFLSWINDRALEAKFFASSDIFVSSSLAESFSLTIAEAMSCGVPALSFAVGGAQEVVLHKKTGYLAENKNFKDFLAGFNWLLSLSQEERTLMFSTSRQRAAENFDVKKMVDNYLALFQSLIKK